MLHFTHFKNLERKISYKNNKNKTTQKNKYKEIEQKQQSKASSHKKNNVLSLSCYSFFKFWKVFLS